MDSQSAAHLKSLIAGNQYTKAINYASGLLALFQDDPQLLNFIGGLLLAFQRHEEAESYLRRALAIVPEDVTLQYNLVLALVGRHQFEEAASLCRQILSAAPGHFATINNLQNILAHLEEFDENEAGAILHGAYAKFFKQNPQISVAASSVMPFASWCRAYGVPIHEMDPPVTVNFTDVQSGDLRTYQTDGYRYASIPGALMMAGWDNAVAPTGHVLDGSGYQPLTFATRFMPHIYNTRHNRVIHAYPERIVDVNEDALFLSAPPDAHFGHWLLDFLPRLRTRNAAATPMKVAVPAGLPSHCRDTLWACGVTPSDVMTCDFGVGYRFRSLTVAQTGSAYKPNPASVGFLYRALGPGEGQPGTGLRRFFLARSGTFRGRAISNQAALDGVLALNGFEIIRRPEIPVQEQNQIFRDAGIVMTVFGTDMLTFLQMQPGSDLIIFMFDDHLHMIDGPLGTAAITSMCQMTGVRLHFLPCAPAQDNPHISGYYRDLVVDCAALDILLASIHERRLPPA